MTKKQDPRVTQAARYAYVSFYAYVGSCYPAHASRTLPNWYTSSASWALLAIPDWMLGVRPHYQGLVIPPCLPSDREQACLGRHWRGALYEATATKPKGLVTG
jgi:cellobiose phosphorylase